MKKLYLVRHAKSSWDNMELGDFDRPLNERGSIDAPRMGKRLNARKLHVDLMLSSPAVRALTTCREIATALEYPDNKIKTDKRLYHADAEQFLSVIKELSKVEGEIKSLMIFGHNPGLTDFANRVFGDTIDNIPTCGIVGGELNIKTWSDTHWNCGEREFFDSPKKKD